MTAPATGNPAVDRFVAQVDPALRDIVEALRLMIRTEAPELREIMRMDVPMYALRSEVCYIAPYSKHVNLGFLDGSALQDPDRLLEGTGKRLRHVKIQSPADADTPKLRSILREAVAHDRS